MSKLQIKSSAEQVSAHLRAELAAGRLRGVMPGVLRLEAELGVNRKTIDAALVQLEREGLLTAQGAGKRRLIVDCPVSSARSLRVAMLLSEPAESRLEYIVELHHELLAAGHITLYAPAAMTDLGMNVRRIARMVERTEADAWIVVAGSKEVLEWFAARPVPVLALFGRREGLPIAAVGPDKRTPMVAAARKLIQLGHRRIVLLVRSRRRLPQPGLAEQAFLTELAAGGVKPGEYNLPEWKETPEGLQQVLSSLFRFTPPTALLVDEPPLFAAAHQFLGTHGLRVPQDVSLICTDPDPSFTWCIPSIAHIRWDFAPVLNRVVRWAASTSKGRPDHRQILTPAEFHPGGTMGPA